MTDALTDAMGKLSLLRKRIKRRKRPFSSPRKKRRQTKAASSPRRRRRGRATASPRRRSSKKRDTRFLSPPRFTEKRRDPRSRERPYNKHTPERSPGGRWKGKGKKHIVAMTPSRSRPYYCGDIRTQNRKGENTVAFHRRRMRDIGISLRLCMEELPTRKRRNVTPYELNSNRKWIATVRKLIQKFERSKKVLKDQREKRAANKLLRLWGDKFAVRKINF